MHDGKHEEKNLREIAELLADAWRTLDAMKLKGIFAEKYEYTSQWVFDTIYGENAYLRYLTGKFEAIRRSGAAPAVAAVRYDDSRVEIDLVQTYNGKTNEAMLSFEIVGGKVQTCCMCIPAFRQLP